MQVSIWQAVLNEVKQQVAQSPVCFNTKIVANEAASPAFDSQTSSWQQQQWQNAFQVLVKAAAWFPSMTLKCCVELLYSSVWLPVSFLRHHWDHLRNRTTCCSLCTSKHFRQVGFDIHHATHSSMSEHLSDLMQRQAHLLASCSASLLSCTCWTCAEIVCWA